jgi:hypothetical protein
MAQNPDVAARMTELLAEARAVLQAIEAVIPHPYTAEGLYQVFAMGFLPVPYLWECREEFAQATRWQTRQIRGGIRLVDDTGAPISAKARAAALPKQGH